MGSGVSKKCREKQPSVESEIDKNSLSTKLLSNINPVSNKSEHPRDLSVNPRAGSKVNCSNQQNPGSVRVVHAVETNSADFVKNSREVIVEKEVDEILEKRCQPTPLPEEEIQPVLPNYTIQIDGLPNRRGSRPVSKSNSIENLVSDSKPNSSSKMSTESNKDMQRASTVRSESTMAKDIMISYSHKDTDMMLKCRDAMEAAGISVWIDCEGLNTGSEFLNKIGQAIVEAKLFMQLLSINSAQSKYCKDELALAYVSNKPIFPIAIEERDDILPYLDFGQKLQLAPVQWTMITKENDFDNVFGAICESMMSTLRKLEEIDGDNKSLEKQITSQKSEDSTGSSTSNKKRAAYKRQRSNLNMPKSIDSPSTKKKEEKKDFWERHFHREQVVSWEKFKETFCKEYSDQLNAHYGQENIEWLMNVIHQEIDEDEDENIQKFHYDEFCYLEGEKSDFWRCVHQQALESYTMRLVFNMDSTVRIDAIQNLGKFNSPSVLEALLDLCKDKDPNVRAVAAISLARVGDSDNKRVVNSLLRLLRDKDRLVRESGCLSLGHIKAKQAVSTIVHLWRNDPISNVREAAQLGLEKIGGEEAQKAMHITRVLSEEIKALALKT